MEKQLDEQLSLRIIREAIENSKSKIGNNAFFYLLWGWLVLVASLLQFALLRFSDTYYHWVGWPVLMTAGGIASFVYGYRLGRKASHITHVDVAMIYLWYGFLVAVTILIAMAVLNVMSFRMMNPLIILLYGLGTFVSGGILKFRPLIVGGLSAWLVSIVAFLVQSDYQLLLMALAIAVAYLIPGYMIKYSSRNHV